MILNKIKNLPLDIIRRIIPYTYNLQNRVLLADIQNYKETKTRVLELYHTFWISHLGLNETGDKWWLINNIMSHLNDYQASMYGHVEPFYDIFLRNRKLKSFNDVDNFLIKLNMKNVDAQINIVWGLLIPSERNDITALFAKNKSYSY